MTVIAALKRCATQKRSLILPIPESLSNSREILRGLAATQDDVKYLELLFPVVNYCDTQIGIVSSPLTGESSQYARDPSRPGGHSG